MRVPGSVRRLNACAVQARTFLPGFAPAQQGMIKQEAMKPGSPLLAFWLLNSWSAALQVLGFLLNFDFCSPLRMSRLSHFSRMKLHGDSYRPDEAGRMHSC